MSRADVDGLVVAFTAEQLWQPTPGGSGTYVVELGGALSALPGVDVVGLAARHGGPPPPDWTAGFPVRHAGLPRTALYEAWNRAGRPRAERVVPGADLVHATTWAVPPTRRPLVVTVHDLAFLAEPGHFTRRGNAWFRRALDRVRADADAVIVPSRTTAQDCIDAGFPAARVHVVPHGARVPEVTEQDVAGLRRHHGVPSRYVLWCGTLEPRKNLRTLLRAYAAARPRLGDVDLVLVGPTGWGDLDLADVPTAGVRVLGRLDRPALHAAYAGATAFAFPSIREGFGLPVLEAMSHGVPVVTSAGTACAEVAGDAALLRDPTDVAGWADALVEATGTAHADLVAASRRRARGFSWASAAEATLEIYRTVVPHR